MFQLGTDTAFRDVSFLLRRSHNEQVASILRDPEAAEGMEYRFLMQQGSGNFTPVADDEE